ncbi:MAG: hypothetical protein JWM27_2801 [Gemmatimonadetes bacterium]|nr:hypothetical protein [Gemmatimonadota bacterium]
MTDQRNPFAVQTPEDLTAEVMVSLFVDVFSDFSMVEKVGHTFLHGPRGSGKSMMFRYLEPDCQGAKHGSQPLRRQPFFGVYLPVRKTDLTVTELARLENSHANVVLNEHLLTAAVAARTFAALRKAPVHDPTASFIQELRDFYARGFTKLVRQSGFTTELPGVDASLSVDDVLGSMQAICDDMYLEAANYLRRLSFSSGPVPYSGPLIGYLDFMVPMVQGLKRLSFMPDGPVYLLVDDADNLNLTQTKILNTWVSYRTSADLSLKISTQLRYKTFLTIFNTAIEAPHDYSEVYISAVYTSKGRSKYPERVREIVRRRLLAAGLEDVTPDHFFPPDEAQERAIARIGERIREEWETSGRGFRPSDDVTRYSRPDFIKGLRGRSKSGSTYSYAGFSQLVHVSDGVIRHFLEAASRMWATAKANSGSHDIRSISPAIQNQVVRDLADGLMAEFDKLMLDEQSDIVVRLRNLVEALGGLFQQIMLSDRSERRAFSIAFSDSPDHEVQEVLELGVRYGYLQRSFIGNKDGTGRTPQYILSRRLAPRFTLDPTSFAGYQFVQNEAIRKALYKPASLVRSVRNLGAEAALQTQQQNLFEIE